MNFFSNYYLHLVFKSFHLYHLYKKKNQERINNVLTHKLNVLFFQINVQKNQKNIFKNLPKHKLFFHQFFKILVYTIKNNFCLKIITNDKIMLLHTCSLILHSHTHLFSPFSPVKNPFFTHPNKNNDFNLGQQC